MSAIATSKQNAENAKMAAILKKIVSAKQNQDNVEVALDQGRAQGRDDLVSELRSVAQSEYPEWAQKQAEQESLDANMRNGLDSYRRGVSAPQAPSTPGNSRGFFGGLYDRFTNNAEDTQEQDPYAAQAAQQLESLRNNASNNAFNKAKRMGDTTADNVNTQMIIENKKAGL